MGYDVLIQYLRIDGRTDTYVVGRRYRCFKDAHRAVETHGWDYDERPLITDEAGHKVWDDGVPASFMQGRI